MRPVHLLTLTLLLVQVACGGSGSSDPQDATSPPPVAGDQTVGLTVQWPAVFTGTGDVHASAIPLPSQVTSLDMTIQVLGSFTGRVTEVSVRRVDGVDETTINGSPDNSGLAGITISVPTGEPVRIFITGTAELTGPRTVSFSGARTLTFTGEEDEPVIVRLLEGGGEGQVPAIDGVDPETPTGAQVGDSFPLVFTATFDDGFQATHPDARYASSDTGVATVDNEGQATITGKGTTVITITVATGTGEELSNQVSITVEDTAPVLEPVADQSDDDGESVSLALDASDADGDPLTYSATGLPTGLTIDTASGQISGSIDPAAARTNSVTVSVSDGEHDASQGFTWVVIDVTAPVVTAPADVTIEARAASTAVALGTATATDLADGTLTPTADNRGPFPVGATTVTWSAMDAAGNLGTATQTVTVTDTTAPDVTAPPDVTVEAIDESTPVDLGTATAHDDVDGDLTPTPDDPGPFALGTHTVTWSATDTAGNSSTATQTVTVRDTTGPMVTAPADVTVEATEPLTPVDLGTATATDAVDGDLTPTASDLGPFAVGVHTVTWSATDTTGNTGTDTQTVTVTDTTAPDVNAPADVTVEATGSTTPVDLGTATATDLVDGDLTPTASDLGPFAIGTHTVTWSATDTAGNTGTDTQTVTVQDTTPPAVTLLFPLGGIVGPNTDVTVLATDLNGVSSVDITAITDDVGIEVPATRDAGAGGHWTAKDVPINGPATILTVVARDANGNATGGGGQLLTTVNGGGVGVTGSGPAEVLVLEDLALEVDASGSVTDVVVADHGLFDLAPPEVRLGGVMRVDPSSGARTQIAGPIDYSVSGTLAAGNVDSFTIDSTDIPGLTAGTDFYAWTYNAVDTTRPDTLLGRFDDSGVLIATPGNPDDNFNLIGDNFASALAGTVNPSGNIVLKVTGASDTGFAGAHTETGSYSLFVSVANPVGANPFIAPDALTVDAASQVFVIDSGVDNTAGGGGFGAALTSDGTIVALNSGPPSQGVWIDVTAPGDGSLLVLDSTECSNVVEVDPISGNQIALVASPNPPCFPGALDVDPISILLAGVLFDPTVYRTNPDGSASPFSDDGNGIPLFASPVNLTVAPDGQIWVVDDSLNAVFSVDPTSGDRTLVSGTGDGANGPEFYSPLAIAVDSRGRVFVIALGDDASFCTYNGVWQINSALEDLGTDGTQPYGSRALISTTLLFCGGSA